MNNRKKIIYSTGGFIVFISVLVSFIALPLFFKIADRANEIITEKKNLNYMIERAQKSDNKVGDLESKLNQVRALYVDPKRPVDEIIFLENIALDNGLDIDINIAGPRDDGNWSYLTFVILIQGDSVGLIRFIETIQNARWIAVINHLNVRRSTERDATKREKSIIADISLNVYFRK